MMQYVIEMNPIRFCIELDSSRHHRLDLPLKAAASMCVRPCRSSLMEERNSHGLSTSVVK